MSATLPENAVKSVQKFRAAGPYSTENERGARGGILTVTVSKISDEALVFEWLPGATYQIQVDCALGISFERFLSARTQPPRSLADLNNAGLKLFDRNGRAGFYAVGSDGCEAIDDATQLLVDFCHHRRTRAIVES